MSKSQKEIKFSASTQKSTNSLYKASQIYKESADNRKSQQGLLSTSPKNSLVSLVPSSSLVSTISQTPKSSTPITGNLITSKQASFTPKPSKDSHPIPYVFHSKSNILSSKNQSSSQKTLAVKKFIESIYFKPTMH